MMVRASNVNSPRDGALESQPTEGRSADDVAGARLELDTGGNGLGRNKVRERAMSGTRQTPRPSNEEEVAANEEKVFSGPPILPPTMGMPAIVDEKEMAAATAALVAKVGGSSLLSSSTASVPMHSLGSSSDPPVLPPTMGMPAIVDEAEMAAATPALS
jgi:hypothetical protein